MIIRKETEADMAAVRSINEAAFGSPAEADLVDRLRREADPLLSLVAQIDGSVVGHILFSPATIEDFPTARIMGLAPMAVDPVHQRQGVGSKLISEGLRQCERLGTDAVIVLGHPEYYPRFGFLPACTFGIRSTYEVPDNVFMAQELRPNGLNDVSGIILYHEAFRSL